MLSNLGKLRIDDRIRIFARKYNIKITLINLYFYLISGVAAGKGVIILGGRVCNDPDSACNQGQRVPARAIICLSRT
jgi:predicted ABC-type sugar transport system permease subunit